MLSASANFLTKNALAAKKPVYLIHFDGESTDYVTSLRIASPDNTIKDYVQKISGNSQSITPEEGKSSIGQITISILDYYTGGAWTITSLIKNDTYNLQHKKTTIKAGYADLTEADMLTIFTGWVTDIKMWSDGCGYDITISDPLKWFQANIFREADVTPVTFGGNPMDILLKILTSTGTPGANGSYDVYAAINSLGIDNSYINVTHIEKERDTWFGGIRWSFDIRKEITAKKFLEKEIFKSCNIYPIIKGDGKFDIKVFRPPLPEETNEIQTFDEDVIIGLPSWDQNLQSVINEVEFAYDYDPIDKEFDIVERFYETTSWANRGVGKKAIEIESKGMTAALGAAEFADRRADRVFIRYAIPPPRLKFSTFFSRQLAEAGDVIFVTHGNIPDINGGSRGITSEPMEIIDRSIDWQRGRCNFTLLHTGWDTDIRYGLISPSSTVLSGASTTIFTLASGEGTKWEVGWVIDIFYKNMVAVATDLEITDISSDQITVGSSIGATPAAGWIITFSTYDNCTSIQKRYGFIGNATNKVGAGTETGYLVY